MPAPSSTIETRGAVEFRAVSRRRLAGHAAVFGSPARIGPEGRGGFTETIARGAFAGSMGTGSDVMALVDHDPGRLLARTRSGTLRLSEDARGLAFELDLPDTTLGRDVLALAERGDLGGMSFGFTVPPGGDAWTGQDRRELRAVALHEISVIHAVPAYAATSVAARARALGDPEAERRRRTMILLGIAR